MVEQNHIVVKFRTHELTTVLVDRNISEIKEETESSFNQGSLDIIW